MFELNPPKNSPGKQASSSLDIEIRAYAGYIQWRYKGFIKWNDIIALSELRGDKGPAGPKGQPGPQGDPGISGPQGPAGERGDPGPTGQPGPKGDQGDPGARGMPGERGFPGEDGKDGKPGKDGREIELRLSKTHIQWRYVGSSLWKNLIPLADIKGEKGDPGPEGEQGPRGERGPQGQPGYNGDRGPMGPMGYTGPAGPAGAGVAPGGATGQVLAKKSGADNDTEWIDSPSSINGFTRQNEELTDTYSYVGYKHADGRWYIYRRTRATNVKLYASGLSDYATNWTNRGSLTYV